MHKAGPENDTTSFGAWLRQKRADHDLTQGELATRAGCAVGTLRNIEAGDARPSKQLAERLARALDVSDAQLPMLIGIARGTGPALDAPIHAAVLAQRDAPAAGARHLHVPHANLPAQLTGLIGRTHIIDAVSALVLRSDVRLVTLTGTGGTGKTRVAVQVAGDVAHAFSSGAHVVDLAAVTDPELVLATIAKTLGLSDRVAQPLSVRLADALRELSLLLVLDNFEQVVSAGPAVADLLAACPLLTVLVTSRILLGLAGEYEWPVPPLTLPDFSALPPLEQLIRYESISLFAERARARDPQFAITHTNAPAVAEICAKLDGLPLAIELAAAWTKLFTPQALLARLDDRLALLTGGRDRPARQQTMRNTLAWSEQLLTANEQLLFQRLGIFVGGATLDAIEVVCGYGELEGTVVSGVAALVNNSLLQRLPRAPAPAAADDAARFGMLEIVREYALERLAPSVDAELVRRRHARYYTALAEAVAASWDSPEADELIAQLGNEYDNLRAVLRWAGDGGNHTLGLRLGVALRRFWQRHGLYAEGRAWLEALLTPDELPFDPAAVATRLQALQAAAWLAADQHDYVRSSQLLEQTSALRRVVGQHEGEIQLLLTAGREARSAGHYGQATALFEQALARHRAEHNRGSASSGGLGQALYDLALVRREQGDFAAATALFEEGLELHRAIGEHEGIAIGLLGLSDLARDRGDGAHAREYGTQSMRISRGLGIQWAVGFALNNLALAAHMQGDQTRASALVDESLELFRELQSDASRAEVLITRARTFSAMGDGAAAYAAFTEALRLAHRLGPRLMVAYALEGLAELLAAHTHERLVLHLLHAAAALRMEMGTPVRPAEQPALERLLVAAKAAVGADTCATVWATAQRLTLEQVCATLPDAADVAALVERRAGSTSDPATL